RRSMPLNLRCDCGTEVHLQDEEMQELTWCPRCRKSLHMPGPYKAQPSLVLPSKSASAPAAGKSASGVPRFAWLGLIVIVANFLRLAASSSSRDTTPPSYQHQPPRFQPPPVQRPIDCPQHPVCQ